MHAARGKKPVEVLGGGLQAFLELLLPAVAPGFEDGIAQNGVDVVHAAVVVAPGNGVHLAHVAGAVSAGLACVLPGKAALAVHPVEDLGDVGRGPLEIALPAPGAAGCDGLLAQLAETLAEVAHVGLGVAGVEPAFGKPHQLLDAGRKLLEGRFVLRLCRRHLPAACAGVHDRNVHPARGAGAGRRDREGGRAAFGRLLRLRFGLGPGRLAGAGGASGEQGREVVRGSLHETLCRRIRPFPVRAGHGALEQVEQSAAVCVEAPLQDGLAVGPPVEGSALGLGAVCLPGGIGSGAGRSGRVLQTRLRTRFLPNARRRGRFFLQGRGIRRRARGSGSFGGFWSFGSLGCFRRVGAFARLGSFGAAASGRPGFAFRLRG